MRGSTHTYTATVDAVVLPVSTGEVTLDAGRAPHVEGTVRIPYTVALAALLDVRVSPPPRLLLTADAVFPGSTQHRAFDLTVRSRPVRHRDGTMTLGLASDEALVDDYAPLENIDLLHVTDLVALCERVVLEATGDTVSIGGETADITPIWDALNLLLNPALDVDTANWGFGTGASGLTRVAAGGSAETPWCLQWSAAAGNSDIYPHASHSQSRATPGKLHVFGIRVQSPTPRNARVSMRFYDAASVLLAEHTSAYTPTSATGWQPYLLSAVAPSQAAFVFCSIHTVGNTAGQQHFAACAYLVVSDFDPGFFYHGTPDTAVYAYAATGVIGASTSTREALVDAPEPAALVWDAGQSGMEFVHPLVQAAGLRLVCDETRTWSLRAENHTAPGALNIRHAVNLVDADDVIDRDDGSWFDAAVTEYVWTDLYGVEQRRRDAYGLPGYSRVRRFEKRTPYPGPGFSRYAVRRAQGRGRIVTVTTVTDWRARAEQPIIARLEGAPAQTGKTDRVVFNLDTDEMTATTRTTDTPPDAWALIPEDLTWADIPTHVTWATFDAWLTTL